MMMSAVRFDRFLSPPYSGSSELPSLGQGLQLRLRNGRTLSDYLIFWFRLRSVGERLSLRTFWQQQNTK